MLLYDDEPGEAQRRSPHMKQHQFLEVLDRDEAERRWRAALDVAPLRGRARAARRSALGRVLAEDVRAAIDVPGLRPLQHGRLRGARRGHLRRQRGGAARGCARGAESIATGVAPAQRGRAAARRRRSRPAACCRAAPTPWCRSRTRIVERRRGRGAPRDGAGRRGLLRGHRRRQRRDGALRRRASHLARDGRARRDRARRSRAWCGGRASRSSRRATRSCSPATPMRPGLVYDSNGRILADAVRELGGEPGFLGAVPRRRGRRCAPRSRARSRAPTWCCSRAAPRRARAISCARVVGGARSRASSCTASRSSPASRSASPLRGKPVVILPGFPTSAVFTFHEFVAPVIRALARRAARAERETGARDARAAHGLRARASRVPARRARAARRRASSPRIRWARAAAA